MQTCFETTIAGCAIKLEQGANKRFRVTYGLQVEGSLCYADAAWRLGEAIMHAAACDGRFLNNEGP